MEQAKCDFHFFHFLYFPNYNSVCSLEIWAQAGIHFNGGIHYIKQVKLYNFMNFSCYPILSLVNDNGFKIPVHKFLHV